MDGRDLKDIPIHKRAAFGVRRTFQNQQIVENLTAGDNIAAVLDNVPTGGHPRGQQIDKALEFVGLCAKRDASGHSLNAYRRRMLEIARATVGHPRLIMMDEPGAGLAQHESEHLAQRDQGDTQLLVAQDRSCWSTTMLTWISATCAATLPCARFWFGNCLWPDGESARGSESQGRVSRCCGGYDFSAGLVVHGLNVARNGKAVLHDVDLVILSGKITALLGANGAGKSKVSCSRSRRVARDEWDDCAGRSVDRRIEARGRSRSRCRGGA